MGHPLIQKMSVTLVLLPGMDGTGRLFQPLRADVRPSEGASAFRKEEHDQDQKHFQQIREAITVRCGRHLGDEANNVGSGADHRMMLLLRDSR
ncbi:hypothetical protein [Ralstonia sp. Ralssp110]|uniref:hypothetical protein n=1 Tax=Ralstonia sp. Ralssp110 TaxID=3243004 RepID=UPI0039B37196